MYDKTASPITSQVSHSLGIFKQIIRFQLDYVIVLDRFANWKCEMKTELRGAEDHVSPKWKKTFPHAHHTGDWLHALMVSHKSVPSVCTSLLVPVISACNFFLLYLSLANFLTFIEDFLPWICPHFVSCFTLPMDCAFRSRVLLLDELAQC